MRAMSPFQLYDTLPFVSCSNDAVKDGCIVYDLHYLLDAVIIVLFSQKVTEKEAEAANCVSLS